MEDIEIMLRRLISNKETFRIAQAIKKLQGPTSHSVQGITVRTGKVIMDKGKFVRFEPDES